MDRQKRYLKCLRCGRGLKSDDSQLLGYGPVCYAKYLSEWNRGVKPLIGGDCIEDSKSIEEPDEYETTVPDMQ